MTDEHALMAAEEIVRLQEENERLRKALLWALDELESLYRAYEDGPRPHDEYRKARRALDGGE